MMKEGKQKNILMLIPNIGFGGAERSFSKLSNLLAERYNVYVAVFNKDSYTKESYEHGGRFIDLDIQTGDSILKKAKAFLDRIKKVRALKKELQIDVTISFLEGADYINILAKGRDKKILCIRGSKTYDRNIQGLTGKLRKRFLIPRLYSKADVIVTVNKGISHELKNDFNVSSKVIFEEIFNYYDLQEMQQKSAETIAPSLLNIFHNPVVISHGRLSHEKGFQYLIPVFKNVKRTVPNARLVLIGDGPYKDHLKQLCTEKSLSCSDNLADIDQTADVFFLGFQKNPLAFLSKATVFTLTSFTEGFPNALAEAMASGVAVAATDCPWGPRDILQGKNTGEGFTLLDHAEYTDMGILLPLLDRPNAIEIWSAALSTLLQDTTMQKQFIANAKKRMDDFSVTKISQQWLQLIERIAP